MNRVLAFLFFMLFLAGLSFVLLRDVGSRAQQAAATANSITSGAWQLPFSTARNSEVAYVEFKNDGTLTGFGGCNSVNGTYIATDRTIDVARIAVTRKACPPLVMRAESAFVGTLESAVAYQIVGSTLTLLQPGGDKLEFRLANEDTDNDDDT